MKGLGGANSLGGQLRNQHPPARHDGGSSAVASTCTGPSSSPSGTPRRCRPSTTASRSGLAENSSTREGRPRPHPNRTHQVEVGVADAMDRTAGAQPVVQRMGSWISGVAEESGGSIPGGTGCGHRSSLRIDATRVNAVRAGREPRVGRPATCRLEAGVLISGVVETLV